MDQPDSMIGHEYSQVHTNNPGRMALFAMAIIPFILFLSLTNRSYSSWSDFAHVTPATEKEYNLHVQLVPLDTRESKFKVKFKAVGYDEKLAWLIITTDALSVKGQQLRYHFWGSAKPEKAIRLKTLIMPVGVGGLSVENDDPAFYEIELEASLMENAYIYIDFPLPVKDGGYFYSIDLGAYLKHYRSKANDSLKS